VRSATKSGSAPEAIRSSSLAVRSPQPPNNLRTANAGQRPAQESCAMKTPSISQSAALRRLFKIRSTHQIRCEINRYAAG
jgi:hypothetical protein